MTVLQELPDVVVIVLLAALQGLTEFLPISSSGHLVVVSELLGKEASAELNIVLHAGTLLSILVFYRRRVLRLLTADRSVIALLFIGTLPVAVLGVAIKLKFPSLTSNPLLAGFMLIITGFVLMAMERLNPEKRKLDYPQLTHPKALIIGVFQAIALLPGISRSGMTIFAGQLCGLRGESAATFSFLLAIPAILGATVFEIADRTGETPIGQLFLGATVSFLVGLLALRWLIHVLNRDKLHLFAYWVIPLGSAVIVWQLYLIASQSGNPPGDLN